MGPIRNRTSLLILGCLWAMCCLGVTLNAEPEAGPPDRSRAKEPVKPQFDPPDPEAARFTGETVELDSVGMDIGVPEGGSASVRQIAGRPTLSISLPGGLGTVMVQSRETGGQSLNVLELERAIVRRTLFRSLSDERIKLTIDTPFETGSGILLGRAPAIPSAGRITRPFYVRLKDEPDQAMRGFSIVQVEPDVFVLFQLFCADEAFAEARDVFELTVKSASLDDGILEDEARAARVAAGEEFLEAMTQDDFAAVVADTPEQFERIYRPAPGGAAADEEEVGYRRVQAWIGSAEDVETGEPGEGQSRQTGDGYVLRVDGSVLLDDGLGGRSRADSRAVYYMSADRRRESWKVEMSIREEGKRGKPDVWNEVGVRVGDSMSVQVTNSNRESSTLRPSIQGEGYISRVEAYLMPALLIQQQQEGEFSFYAYDQSAEVNRIRTLSVERSSERPGLWNVTMSLPGDQEERAVYNEYGRLIRSETSEGVIKRPIEFERLYQIWRAKDLPLD